MTDIQTFIENKGGTFGEIYTTDDKRKRKYVRFTCENGHQNDKRIDTITGSCKTGKTWCIKCCINSRKKVDALAVKRGFKFLSEKYITSDMKYDWECQKGHVFSAKYSNIHSGKGCPKCLRIPFEALQKLADKRGGKCLTDEKDFINTCNTKFTWQCKEGHIWQALYHSIKKGSWCPQCQENISERTCRRILEFIFKVPFRKFRPVWLNKMELDGYNEELQLAFEYNGAQHYETVPYWHKTEDAFLKQKERDRIKAEKCSEHGVYVIRIPYTVKYEDLYEYIFSWCPFVPKDTPETIDYAQLELSSLSRNSCQDINNYVKEKWGGKMLTDNYVNNTTKMDFECCRGHTFQQTWGSILAGIFCKKCTYQTKREKMQEKIEEFAKKHTLDVLDKFESAKSLMSWRCLKCENVFAYTWDNIRMKKIPCCKL